MSSLPRTITIIGAGFSGTSVALNLLRSGARASMKIVLVDVAAPARGVAYARRNYPFLLNVPAGRMSASNTDPGEFLRFARARLPHAGPQDFLARELYGQYLEASLAAAERAAQVQFERVRGLVIAVAKVHRGSGLQLHFADGRTRHAEAVVLALGNPPPAPLAGTEGLRPTARCIQDPWAQPQDFRPGETVLAVGTGLTMADVVLAGMRTASGSAVVHAISRRGLLPPPQSAFEASHTEGDGRALLRAAALSARHLVRAVRTLAADIEQRHGDWREAIAFVRTLAPALWQRLSQRERGRFLRHAHCHWDIHRHRLPPQSWQALQALRRSGNLAVHAGRIVSLESVGRQIRVTWRARGELTPQRLLVDRVINCTGPDYDARRTRERLLRSLLAQGLACPDALGLGLLTDDLGALTDALGRTATNLYYIGPMLRAAHWETTAVPELRHHAARLAQHLLEPRPQLDPGRHGRPPTRSAVLHA